MFYCERCGEADCCERMDLPTEPVLCDACYEKATREKLIDVFMHIGDHITNRDEYGICFDTPLAKAIEDVLAMLKSQDAHGVTVQEWISVKDRLPTPYMPVLVCKQPLGGQQPFMTVDYITIGYGETKIWVGDIGTWKNEVTHWMPLPQPPKGE